MRIRMGTAKAKRQQATEMSQLRDIAFAQYSFQMGSLKSVHIIINSNYLSDQLQLEFVQLSPIQISSVNAEFNKIIMSLNLDKLVSSEANYEKMIKQFIDTIRKDKNIEATLKKIILFCKYAFSVNYAQHKKLLCLMLIRDISEALKSQEFEKILDENIPIKLLKTLSQQMNNRNRESRHQDDQMEFSQRLIKFAVQTISFWTKKLSFLPGKSQFAQAYEDLKKMKVDLPKTYQFYKSEKLTLGLWGDRQQNSQEFIKNEQMSPLINELSQKFTECKGLIQQRINQAVLNQEEIYLKTITQKLRDFLLSFFSKYKSLQVETTIDRDVLVVYFHIVNNLFKRISNRFYIPVQEMITLTKQVFEGNHSADFSSVDRMDIINLAGIHKYNALTIFQRIHNRIQMQQAKLGPCELSFEQKDVLEQTNQKKSLKKDRSDQFQEKKIPKFKR